MDRRGFHKQKRGIGLVILATIIGLSGCVGQIGEKEYENLSLIPLIELVEHPEYQFKNDVRLRGEFYPYEVLYLPDTIYPLAYQLFDINNASVSLILGQVTAWGTGLRPSTNNTEYYGQIVDVTGYLVHSPDFGYWFAFELIRLTPLSEPEPTPAVVTVTITVRDNETNINEVEVFGILGY